MTTTDNEIETERNRIAALRMQMLEMHPFWGYMLLQIKLIAAVELPVFAATDCTRHIWYNPTLTKHLSAQQLGFVLAHEVCHQVFASQGRQYGRENHKWNCATDYAINIIVSDIEIPGSRSHEKLYDLPNVSIPGLGEVEVLHNPRYRGWLAEIIYEDLCKKAPKTQPSLTKIILTNAQGGKSPLPSISNHHGGIDIHLPVHLGIEEQNILKERIAAAVENYEATKQQGNLPFELLRQLGFLAEPKIPWKRLLHRYADMILGSDDYSLIHPNKHYWAEDLVVPGRHGEQVGKTVVALDTSGSMSEEELREIAAEIRGMIPNAEDITLIVADHEIQQVVPFNELESFLDKAEFRGGGGTDHVCIFDYIEKNKIHPRLFIGLTDLYSDFPIKKPPFPVIWITTESHGTPPWGKVITI